MVGDRIISSNFLAWPTGGERECSKNTSSYLYSLYCSGHNNTDDCDYFEANEVGWKRGIPGLPSGNAQGMMSGILSYEI